MKLNKIHKTEKPTDFARNFTSHKFMRPMWIAQNEGIHDELLNINIAASKTKYRCLYFLFSFLCLTNIAMEFF